MRLSDLGARRIEVYSGNNNLQLFSLCCWLIGRERQRRRDDWRSREREKERTIVKRGINAEREKEKVDKGKIRYLNSD